MLSMLQAPRFSAMHQQALALAYVDAFNMLRMLILLGLLLILLLPKGRRSMAAAVH
jgi:hypothetical protein